MVGSAGLDCSAWMRKSFLVIVDGVFRHWTAAPRKDAFLLAKTRRAVHLGLARSQKYEAVRSGQQMGEVPV